MNMTQYVVLLRGINVGGKNNISMAELRVCLESLGFRDVITLLGSGNVLLASEKPANEVQTQIEAALPGVFQLDDQFVRVLVLSSEQFAAVVRDHPQGFGDEPSKYHCDVIFLIGIESSEAITAFNPREGVDTVWAGNGVVYSQRLSALRTKSRLKDIMVSPLYKSMTIRSWNTVTRLLNAIFDNHMS